jgi:hypothetical protein
MKNLLFIIILSPLLSFAQRFAPPKVYKTANEINIEKRAFPRLEGDTLFTSSGYKMYPGQVLHIGLGTGKDGGFRFLKMGTGYGSSRMDGASLLIESVSDLRTSTVGNLYILIQGTITFKGGSRAEIMLNTSFDKALEDRPGLPSELIVPDEFKVKSK